MIKKHMKLTVILTVCAAVVFICSLIIYHNKKLSLSEIDICSEDLPKSFSGFCIAHVSDLHNTEFKERNSELLSMISDASPDIIAITGDLIDSRRTKTDVAVSFVEEASKIAPVYYVTGNHEARLEDYLSFAEAIENAGATILENEKVTLWKEGESITLVGIADPNFTRHSSSVEVLSECATAALSNIICDDDGYTVLLSHRPELIETYTEFNIDLVLCGHVHGGQIRIPFIGGLYGPGQGLFPKYDSGLYTVKDTDMVVSRGLGNSKMPLRINNDPQLLAIRLRTP